MNILGILTGTAICLGGIGSYIPQFYNIIKYESVEGISEMCLVLMNIGLMCLTMNSLIYNWNYFFCDSAECFSNLFPFIQIALSWFMVLIYYIIFITYKFKNRNNNNLTKAYKKRIFFGLHYVTTYLLFIIFVIALSLGEKVQGNLGFFKPFADILGYSSAVMNSLVYIPQIYILYKNKSGGNVSMLMYIVQTPGNLVIIIFQIMFNSPVSTWITYVIVLIEQFIILFLLIYYGYCYVDINLNIEKEEEISSILDSGEVREQYL